VTKVIISCAVTGSIHTPSMSPHLPTTAAEIAKAALGAAEAGGAQAAAMGGQVRVGVEDNLWLDKGVPAPSNAAQVTRVRQILEGLGLDIAFPAEARQILALKRGDNVGF
jgi:uncharacterized protein (DUF849 family)